MRELYFHLYGVVFKQVCISSSCDIFPHSKGVFFVFEGWQKIPNLPTTSQYSGWPIAIPSTRTVTTIIVPDLQPGLWIHGSVLKSPPRLQKEAHPFLVAPKLLFTCNMTSSFKFSDRHCNQHKVAVGVCSVMLPTLLVISTEECMPHAWSCHLPASRASYSWRCLPFLFFGNLGDGWRVWNACNIYTHLIFLPLHHLTSWYGHILLYTFPCCKNVSFKSIANYFHKYTWEPHSCPPTINHTHTILRCWQWEHTGEKSTSHLPPLLSLLL